MPSPRKYIIISLVIAALLVVAFLVASNSPLTGRITLAGLSKQDSQSSADEDSKGSAAVSAASAASSPGPIQVNTSFELESYELPVSDLDIAIVAKEVVITGKDFDITLSLDEPMELKSFSGTLSWANSRFVLSGELSQYLSTLVKINLKGSDELKLAVSDGTVSLDTVRLSDITGIATGTITIGDDASFTVTKEEVSFSDYRGPLALAISPERSSLSLDGTVSGFDLTSRDYTVSIR